MNFINTYGIKNYTIPNGYLCPPIPGRADYIHHIADLLASCNNGVIPKGQTVKGLDVGIGANGIYSIIGSSVYDWNFVGSDIEIESIAKGISRGKKSQFAGNTNLCN